MKLLGDGFRLEIDILGYKYTEAVLREDRNWLSCKVTGEHIDGEFKFDCLIQTYDLIEWMKSLKSDSSLVVLSFPEDDASISMRKEDGCVKQVEISYTKKWSGGAMSQKVVFATQMLAKEICETLEEMMLAYPVL